MTACDHGQARLMGRRIADVTAMPDDCPSSASNQSLSSSCGKTHFDMIALYSHHESGSATPMSINKAVISRSYLCISFPKPPVTSGNGQLHFFCHDARFLGVSNVYMACCLITQSLHDYSTAAVLHLAMVNRAELQYLT